MANPVPGHLRGLGERPGPVQNQPAPPHPGTIHLVKSASRLSTLPERDRIMHRPNRLLKTSPLQGRIKPFQRDLPDHEPAAHAVAERGIATLGAEFFGDSRVYLLPEIG